jgi:hypothetical protein
MKKLPDGLLVVFLRLVLGVFLGFTGMFIGYLFGWAAFLSMPGGFGGGAGAGLSGMAVGAGVGASIAWWDTEVRLRFKIAAILIAVGVALLGAWIGQQGVSVQIGATRGAVQRFVPVALGAVAGGNVAAFAIFYAHVFIVGRVSRISGVSEE